MKRQEIHRDNYTNEYDLSDVLLLLWVTAFFVFTISSLYPQMSLRPGLDIVGHFSSTMLLRLSPEAYSSSYPWFHLTWATVYELSNPSMEVFQTGLAYVSLVVIFSFYLMARAYLRDFDKSAPSIATIFFSVFAGFGWLYFLQEKLLTLDSNNQLAMLAASNDVSYWDVGYGQGSWVWFWFRPMTISSAIFFVLLYLLNRKDISERKFIAIFSILIITLGVIHVPELMLFNIFLMVLQFFILKMLGLRLKEASIATLIGSVTYLSYVWISGVFGGLFETPSIETLLILLVTAIISYILAHKSPWKYIKTSFIKSEISLVSVYVFVIALIFMTGLLTWYSSPGTFSSSYVSETYYIPLILYPVLLGIIGFFALHGFVIIIKKHRSDPSVVFVLLFFFTITFGKLISLLNVYLLNLGYGEKRFLPIIFASASIMASTSFLKQALKPIHEKKNVRLIIIITLFVITGITSTNLSVEYWKSTNEINKVSNNIMDATEYLSSPSNRDVRTPMLTAPTSTRSMAAFVPSPYVIDAYRYPIWESQYPEIPLLILYNKYYLSPYLYLNYKDLDRISISYADEYFSRHMLQLLPKAYSNPEITVYKFPEGAPPSPSSTVLLVTPGDERADYLYAYDMLSLGQYEYTTCLNSDVNTIVNGKTIILPRDNEDYQKLLENLKLRAEFQQDDKEIIIFNFNGYGPLADLFFNSQNHSKNMIVQQIKRDGLTLDLPIDVDVPSLLEKDSVKVLAWYSNRNEEAPFSAELVNDDIRLVYINVYPIIKTGLKEEVVMDSKQILNLIMSEFKDGKIKDVSMNENDGLVYGAKTTDSPFGMALDFDGKENFIKVLNSDKLNPTNEITIEAWIKPRNPDSGFTIISKKASFNSLNGYTFLFDGSSFYFNIGNGKSYFPNAFNYGRLKDGQWYHLAVTYDGNYIKYYVNGAEVGSVKQSETIAANNLNFLIGKRQDETWKLNGAIYKIVVYDKALTASKIGESFNQTKAKFWTTNPMSSILGSIIQMAGVDLPAHVNFETWVFEGNTAFFRSASLKGNIVIKSSSFIDITIDESANVTIITEEEQTNVTHIKELYINKTDYSEIRVQEAAIQQGRGFYTKLTLINPTLSSSGEKVLITLVTGDQKTREIIFQNGELRTSGQITLYARTPTFQVDGEAEIKKMYSLFSLYPKLRCLGQDLSLNGTVGFQLTVSDIYNFASNIKWDGLVARKPPILPWSESDSIKNMMPWSIISMVLIVFWHAFFGKETSDHKEG